MLRPNINLLNGPATLLGDPQAFDTDLDSVVCALPHIGKPASTDWVVTYSGELTRNSVRRRQYPVVATDELKFV